VGHYNGGWNYGTMHGKLVTRFAENDANENMLECTGGYNRGNLHGKGTLKWRDGKVYTDNFVNSLKHRLGKHKEGESGYKGEWQHGLPHGWGKYSCSNGDVFVGQYVNGRQHYGWGTYTYHTGAFMRENMAMECYDTAPWRVPTGTSTKEGVKTVSIMDGGFLSVLMWMVLAQTHTKEILCMGKYMGKEQESITTGTSTGGLSTRTEARPGHIHVY